MYLYDLTTFRSILTLPMRDPYGLLSKALQRDDFSDQMMCLCSMTWEFYVLQSKMSKSPSREGISHACGHGQKRLSDCRQNCQPRYGRVVAIGTIKWTCPMREVCSLKRTRSFDWFPWFLHWRGRWNNPWQHSFIRVVNPRGASRFLS